MEWHQPGRAIATVSLLDPGQRQNGRRTGRNLGSVVDRYRCEILGLDPAWWTVTPASLELFPQRDAGEERGRTDAPPTVGRFTVMIRPPRSSAALAGSWGIGAKVSSEHEPAERAVEETAESLGLSSRIVFSGEERPLPSYTERLLYRLAREALYQVQQHTSARKLRFVFIIRRSSTGVSQLETIRPLARSLTII